ncbi:MAG TPA: hypothetical protein PLZ36_07900 [Armatimonadota bacterium]|nr:hypothetical protein [Armatimonadota bacterium]HOS43788.1 hypothetical protein [Armatimonadota bacterium]
MLSYQQTDLWTPLPGSWEEAVVPNLQLAEMLRREPGAPPPDDIADPAAARQTPSATEAPPR